MNEQPGSKFIRWRNRQLEVTDAQGVWVSYRSHPIACKIISSRELSSKGLSGGLLFSQGYKAMQHLLSLGYEYKQGDTSSLES